MSYGTLQIEKMTTESGYSLGAGNASSFKNRLINGGMVINQRAVTSVSGGTEVYTLDRWIVTNYFLSNPISVAQSSDAPAGFAKSILVTNGTGEALGASDFGSVRQKIEGLNFYDLAWGTASAKTITISFWVKSSVAGNYTVGVINGALTRANRTLFTVNSTNTWEQKTVTFVGDTTGTWATDNSTALYMDIVFVAGSNNYGTADTWTANTLEGLSGASANWVTSTSATFQITGVQLEVGTVATSFDFRSYGTELALCQRYYFKTFAQGTAPAQNVAANNQLLISVSPASTFINGSMFPVAMRTAPTVVTYNPYAANSSFRIPSSSTDVPITGYTASDWGVSVFNTSLAAPFSCHAHYTASAEL